MRFVVLHDIDHKKGRNRNSQQNRLNKASLLLLAPSQDSLEIRMYSPANSPIDIERRSLCTSARKPSISSLTWSSYFRGE
jgi:hypothetical protein